MLQDAGLGFLVNLHQPRLASKAGAMPGPDHATKGTATSAAGTGRAGKAEAASTTRKLAANRPADKQAVKRPRNK